MRARRLVAILGAVALTGAALLGPGVTLAAAGTAAPSHKGILPPKNPSRSLPPKPFFLSSAHCTHGKDGSKCNSIVLKAVAHARKVLEKMAGMSFSLRAYEKLSAREQLFVTVNLERTERGLRPAAVLTRSLDNVAQAGANADQDPPLGKVPDPLPGGGRPAAIGGNWAGGLDNALGSDYGWMYDDGPHSPNSDCTKTHKAGCWGHRDNILGTFNSTRICGGPGNELAMGAGHVTKGKRFGDSETEVLAGVCGPIPTDTVFTWRKAKRLLHIRA
jgi:hypothetical protein